MPAMKARVYDKENKAVGEIEIPDAIFGRAWNGSLVRQVVLASAANRRKPIAHTKNRSEVSGGGKKPWRQKGTGRARHGSIRSPLWKGGGTTFGPRNERTYAQKVNKKMLRAALHIVLSRKLKDGDLKFIDSLALERAKTRDLRWVLPGTLLVPAPGNRAVYRASANLPRVAAQDPRTINAAVLLQHKTILVDKAAAETIR
jgi:large subunit ribosomal protein L4